MDLLSAPRHLTRLLLEFEGNKDFRREYLGVGTISYFPGSGKEHPIQPGKR